MKLNYPVANGGAAQVRYEALHGVQRNGMKTLLKTADLKLERMRRVVDLCCRHGDTTLGLLEYTSGSSGTGLISVTGVEEIRAALLLAKVKFGVASPEEVTEISTLVESLRVQNGSETLDFGAKFLEDASTRSFRLQLVNSSIEVLPSALGEKADAIVGFQVLQWLNADESGLPKQEIINAIAETLLPGGVFIGGTSTAFIQIDPTAQVDGKTKSEYSIDFHPFMQMVCAKIEAAVTTLLSHAPEPVTASPPLSTDGLVARFAAAGFIDIQTGAFLVGAGREALINEVVNIRPIHQGRLNGVADSDRERIITQAIAEAHSECDAIVISGEPDPRKVETNLWDAVPFLKAVKSAVAPRTKKLSGPDMDELAEAPWFVGGGTSHGNKGDRPILDGFDRGD